MPSLATRVAARTLRWLPRKGLSRGLGQLASRPAGPRLVKRAIDVYVRAYDVDLGEADVPSDGFRTFDEFFTRSLVPGARPIEGGDETLSSPADGRVEALGPIHAGARLRVKGTDYSVGQLLGDERDAASFEGGSFAVIYLSPRDYHRVHAPVRGQVSLVRHVGGTLLPVNAFGMANFPNLLARNERVAVMQRSDVFGEVATVMVGAVGVGRISLAFDSTVMTNVGRGPTTVHYAEAESPWLDRGDELGKFHLGSTAIVFVGPGVPLTLRPTEGARLRVGQALAVIEP